MNNKLLLLLFFCLMQKVTFSQKHIYNCDSCSTLKGEIIDFRTNEPLPNTIIFIDSTTYYLFALSDSAGKYVISNIPPGKHKVVVVFVGYEKKEQNISLRPNEKKELNFSLIDLSKALDLKLSKQADIDIANGNIRILLGGFQFANPARDSVAKQYGFYYDLMGCSFTEGDLYNGKMYKYLENKYGKDFIKRFNEEVEEYKKNK